MAGVHKTQSRCYSIAQKKCSFNTIIYMNSFWHILLYMYGCGRLLAKLYRQILGTLTFIEKWNLFFFHLNTFIQIGLGLGLECSYIIMYMHTHTCTWTWTWTYTTESLLFNEGMWDKRFIYHYFCNMMSNYYNGTVLFFLEMNTVHLWYWKCEKQLFARM